MFVSLMSYSVAANLLVWFCCAE